MASLGSYSSTNGTRTMVGSSCLIDKLLSADILRSIFKRLSYKDRVRLKTVSSYWNSLYEDQIVPLPCLILPSKEVTDGDGNVNVNNHAYSGIFKLGGSQVSNLTRIPNVFREGCCVGSSNGWLVFLEDQAVPSLFHLVKQVQIQLPSLLLDNFLGLKKMERNHEGNYNIEYSDHLGITYSYTKNELQNLIRKVILIGEPDHNYNNFGVIMLCNKGSNDVNHVFLYYNSESKLWKSTPLDLEDPDIDIVYQDIIWHEDHLYALTEKEIEIWDLEDDILVKKRENILIPRKVSNLRYGILYERNGICECGSKCGYKCGSKWYFWFYLCESCGDILLVVRCIRTFKDLNLEKQTRMFLTRMFLVYKLDINDYEFLEIESLDDRMLFVGGNQSTSASIQSFPTCERNSIYYTDNEIEGYDMGVYSLTKRDVKPILKFSSRQIVPPPYLIIPPSTTTTSSHLKL